MTPDPLRHQRRSVRLKHYDYAQAGIYFVTLCTRDRKTYFDDGAIREAASAAWQAIPDHADRVSLDEWVIMPNHLHGLLVLADGAPVGGQPRSAPEVSARAGFDRESASRASPIANSLAVIVRTYKAAVTQACRRMGRADFGWQRSYYEHVVRSPRELDSIRRYIADNPLQWALDHDNPINSGRAPTASPWIF